MATIPEIASHQEHLANTIRDLSLHDQSDLMKDNVSAIGDESGEIILAEPKVGLGPDSSSSSSRDSSHRCGFCAVCLNAIVLQETALVKGCEHAYCVSCILQWATYKNEPTCPQCKHPFEFLHVHRCLDGSLRDYMFEESVCLLLRASWFKPLIVEEKEEVFDEIGFYHNYELEDDDEDLNEAYFSGSSSLRIGNRRWGDNGFVRAGRQEARPVPCPNVSELSAGPSCPPRKKKAGNGKESAAAVGRRAKRAMKREAADQAAAAKHQQLLVRLGRVKSDVGPVSEAADEADATSIKLDVASDVASDVGA